MILHRKMRMKMMMLRMVISNDGCNGTHVFGADSNYDNVTDSDHEDASDIAGFSSFTGCIGQETA